MESNVPDARFYLQPIRNPNGSIWFSKQPLGLHTIGNIAKNMAQQANLHSTRKTNHSGRKTAIQALLHSQVPPTDVMQLSGHKNIQSLNSYSHLSLNQQQSLSNIISKRTTCSSNMQKKRKAQAENSQDKQMCILTSNSIADEELNLLLLSDEFATEMEPGELTTSTPYLTMPPAISKSVTFENCTISGNITINIQQAKRKWDESDSDQ